VSLIEEPLYEGHPGHNTRDMHGNPLVPGVNVDPVNIAAGLRMATQLGYGDPTAQMVAQYALQRHQRGEEEGAQRTWLHEYPHDLTSWYAILAHAVATPKEQS
jgi:hypothetical protein